MENKEIRFQAVLDDPEFMKKFDKTMNNVMIKHSAALEAKEISEKLDNRENIKHHLKNVAGIGIGGSAFVAFASIGLAPLVAGVASGAAVAAAPVVLPLALAFGFGGWLMKTISTFKKDDDLSINKNHAKNKEYASYIVNKTNSQFDEVNTAIKEYRNIREAWNNGTLESSLDNKTLVLNKMLTLNKKMESFVNNLDNDAYDDEHRVMAGIVSDGKLLSKNSLAQKIENMVNNVQEAKLRSKHGI